MVESDVVTNELVGAESVVPSHVEARRLTGCSLSVKVHESVSNTTVTIHSRVQGKGVTSEFVRSTEGELRGLERALQTGDANSHPRIVACRARWTFTGNGSSRVHVTVTVARDGRTVKGKGVHMSHTFAMALAYEHACRELHRTPLLSVTEQQPILLPNPLSFSK